MSDAPLQPTSGQPFAAATNASALSTLVPAPAPDITAPQLPIDNGTVVAGPVVNTDTLRSLLVVLGHDIEADWDHLVALARKVL